MQTLAGKLDWLKERKDFHTNPIARAATRLLEHQYMPHGEDLYPWILREIKRGNIEMPSGYKHWGKIVEMEMAAERELKRREALDKQWEEEGANPYPSPESWGSGNPIAWDDLENADWNKLTDFVEDMNRPQYGSGPTPWEAINATGGGLRFTIKNPQRPDDPQGHQRYLHQNHTLDPQDLRDWEKVLADRAKRRQGVDPMQFAAHDFKEKMNNEWLPESQARLRADKGEILHRFPDKWTIRKLKDAEEAEQEGEDMGHCIGSYGDSLERGNTHLFSLRDSANRPHASFEIKPDKWRNQGIPKGLFEKHGINDPYIQSIHVDSINHMIRAADEVDDPYYVPIQVRAEPDSIWPRLWEIAKEVRAQRRSTSSEPWHGGRLVQVQGKENSPPIEDYKDRIREWFASMPQEQWPTNLLETYYHPSIEQAPNQVNVFFPARQPEPIDPDDDVAWNENMDAQQRGLQAGDAPGLPVPGGMFDPNNPNRFRPPEHPIAPPIVPDEGHWAHVARTEEHHPAPAHKNRVTGEICHCPWGPERDLWSWNEDPHLLNLDHGHVRSHVGKGRDLSPSLRGRPPRSRDRADGPGQQGALHGASRPLPERRGVRDGSDNEFQDADWDWTEPDDTDQDFQQVVDLFGGTGLISNFTETPEAVNISLLDVPEERRGKGTGTRFMQAAKKYCDDNGKQLIVSEVDNVPFFGKLPFLNYEKTPGRPRFVSSDHTCPTCGDPLQGEFGTYCPRCSWSEDNANLDSDPLSNPPDPTVDMHRGIQSGANESDRIRRSMAESSGDPKLDAVIQEFKSLPDLQPWYQDDPGHDEPDPTERFREGWRAEGHCGQVMQAFNQFAQSKGLYVVPLMESPNTPQEIDGTPESWGYADRPNTEGFGGGPDGKPYPGHAATIVRTQTGTYMVDWTASQYGYSEFPMVQRLDEGQWQRDWPRQANVIPSHRWAKWFVAVEDEV